MNSEDFSEDVNLVFKGTDGDEAETFITGVQRTARTQGKSRNNEWIIDLVSSCMTGGALRWYVGLDEDTQNDWKLLRKAILERYPPLTEPSTASSQPTIPTPAAAPTPSNPISSIQPTQASKAIYRIRVYFATKKSNFVLSIYADNAHICLTNDDAKGFNVRWTSGSELRLVENVADHVNLPMIHISNPPTTPQGLETQRMISLVWYFPGKNGNSPSSTSEFAGLVISDPSGNAPSIGGYSGATRIISWILDQDGGLQSYSNINQTRYQNRFFVPFESRNDSLIQACPLAGRDGLSIEDDKVFTMKLEPV